MGEAFLLFCWLAYFYLHSLLAAISVKRFFIQLFAIRSARIYRIGYNLFSIIGLIALLYLQIIVPSAQLYTTRLITDCIAFCTMATGLVIMVTSIRNYNWKSFIGMSEEKQNALIIGGLNKYVRHPLYSGTMLWAAGYFIYQPYQKNILLLILMWIYLAIGLIYEERKLVKIYGDEYKNYQKNVKKMIPFVW